MADQYPPSYDWRYLKELAGVELQEPWRSRMIAACDNVLAWEAERMAEAQRQYVERDASDNTPPDTDEARCFCAFDPHTSLIVRVEIGCERHHLGDRVWPERTR